MSTNAGAGGGRTGETERTRIFHELHRSGCFVIPNPWNVGSALLLAQLGFRALATTSSGFAWSLGRRDRGITLDLALTHFRELSDAVPLPINADFEDGFAAAPEDVAVNVARAARTGIAGVSIEDSKREAGEPLYELSLAVERITAARRAIDQTGTGVLLVGRTESTGANQPPLPERIRRLTAYADAGADCLFAPGLRSLADIRAVVQAVAPKPVNVLVNSDFATVAQLAEVGVRRISVGGALARAALTGFLAAAREIADQGTFRGLGAAIPSAQLQSAFAEP
jgi:2-methylisocitrate lyase-like PEP mutase family enzyme